MGAILPSRRKASLEIPCSILAAYDCEELRAKIVMVSKRTFQRLSMYPAWRPYHLDPALSSRAEIVDGAKVHLIYCTQSKQIDWLPAVGIILQNDQIRRDLQFLGFHSSDSASEDLTDSASESLIREKGEQESKGKMGSSRLEESSITEASVRKTPLIKRDFAQAFFKCYTDSMELVVAPRSVTAEATRRLFYSALDLKRIGADSFPDLRNVIFVSMISDKFPLVNCLSLDPFCQLRDIADRIDDLMENFIATGILRSPQKRDRKTGKEFFDEAVNEENSLLEHAIKSAFEFTLSNPERIFWDLIDSRRPSYSFVMAPESSKSRLFFPVYYLVREDEIKTAVIDPECYCYGGYKSVYQGYWISKKPRSMAFLKYGSPACGDRSLGDMEEAIVAEIHSIQIIRGYIDREGGPQEVPYICYYSLTYEYECPTIPILIAEFYEKDGVNLLNKNTNSSDKITQTASQLEARKMNRLGAMYQLLLACVWLEKHHIAHRDMKLSNLFIKAMPRPLKERLYKSLFSEEEILCDDELFRYQASLGDFGAAANTKAADGGDLTSPEVLAPEYILTLKEFNNAEGGVCYRASLGIPQGKEVNNQTLDTWSLGVCLASLYTGEFSPWIGGSNSSTLLRLANKEHVEASIPLWLPDDDIGNLIKKFLQIDPQKRILPSQALPEWKRAIINILKEKSASNIENTA